MSGSEKDKGPKVEDSSGSDEEDEDEAKLNAKPAGAGAAKKGGGACGCFGMPGQKGFMEKIAAGGNNNGQKIAIPATAVAGLCKAGTFVHKLPSQEQKDTLNGLGCELDDDDYRVVLSCVNGSFYATHGTKLSCCLSLSAMLSNDKEAGFKSSILDVNKKLLTKKAVVHVSGISENKPCLYFFKYDVTPCTDELQNSLREKRMAAELTKSDPEEETTFIRSESRRIFELHSYDFAELLAKGKLSTEGGKHPMVGGYQCMCQHIIFMW